MTRYRFTILTEPRHSKSHVQELADDDAALEYLEDLKDNTYRKYPESRGVGYVKAEEVETDRLLDQIDVPSSL